MNETKSNEIKALLMKLKTSGVSHDPNRGLQDTLRYQDLIGTSSMKELAELERNLTDDERRMFVFANTCALDQSTCIDIYVKTIGRRKITAACERERGSLEKWEAEIAEKQHALNVAECTNANAVAAAHNLAEMAKQELRTAIRHHEEREANYALNVKSYRQRILDLEAELEAMSKENADLQAVKRVLASLPKA